MVKVLEIHNLYTGGCVAASSNFPYATDYILPCSKEIVELFMYAYVISIMMNIMYYRCDYLIYICV